MHADDLGATPTVQSLHGINCKLVDPPTYRDLVDDFYDLAQHFASQNIIASPSVHQRCIHMNFKRRNITVENNTVSSQGE